MRKQTKQVEIGQQISSFSFILYIFTILNKNGNAFGNIFIYRRKTRTFDFVSGGKSIL